MQISFRVQSIKAPACSLIVGFFSSGHDSISLRKQIWEEKAKLRWWFKIRNHVCGSISIWWIEVGRREVEKERIIFLFYLKFLSTAFLSHGAQFYLHCSRLSLQNACFTRYPLSLRECYLHLGLLSPGTSRDLLDIKVEQQRRILFRFRRVLSRNSKKLLLLLLLSKNSTFSTIFACEHDNFWKN